VLEQHDCLPTPSVLSWTGMLYGKHSYGTEAQQQVTDSHPSRNPRETRLAQPGDILGCSVRLWQYSKDDSMKKTLGMPCIIPFTLPGSRITVRLR
jgi:hypothetical protein